MSSLNIGKETDGTTKELSDVWTLESPRQIIAIEEINLIIETAMKFSGIKERAYLRKLWDGESWKSIKSKLLTEGSVWYVWFMDGVNKHISLCKGKANE